MNRPKVVCLCGSTRFREAFASAHYTEGHTGNIVLTVYCYKNDPCCKGPEDWKRLDALHKHQIDMADEILVLNVDGYIGDSTKNEVLYATLQNKGVRWLEPGKAWVPTFEMMSEFAIKLTEEKRRSSKIFKVDWPEELNPLTATYVMGWSKSEDDLLWLNRDNKYEYDVVYDGSEDPTSWWNPSRSLEQAWTVATTAGRPNLCVPCSNDVPDQHLNDGDLCRVETVAGGSGRSIGPLSGRSPTVLLCVTALMAKGVKVIGQITEHFSHCPRG
jgi:hypothetical protein